MYSLFVKHWGRWNPNVFRDDYHKKDIKIVESGARIVAFYDFEFKEKFIGFAQNKLAGVQFLPRIYVDAEVKLEQINWRLVEALADFEPFGQGNHKPKFLISGLTLMSVETVGLESKHLRLMVQEGS